MTYEPTEVVHAIFDQATTRNRWTMQARMLREFVEHFGQRTEQLEMHSENGRVSFTSYTEMIKDGRGMHRI